MIDDQFANPGKMITKDLIDAALYGYQSTLSGFIDLEYFGTRNAMRAALEAYERAKALKAIAEVDGELLGGE